MEIYFLELESKGAGIEAYLKLINRGEKNKTFEEHVTDAGLTSPFAKDVLKELADNIHYNILGSYYYSESNNNSNAA